MVLVMVVKVLTVVVMVVMVTMKVVIMIVVVVAELVMVIVVKGVIVVVQVNISTGSFDCCIADDRQPTQHTTRKRPRYHSSLQLLVQ